MWIRDICPKTEYSTFLKNKFAAVLVQLVKLEYPERWPSFFQELLLLLNQGERVIDLFLRVLDTIDEEIVSRNIQRTKEELARNTIIKDAMRTDCIPHFASAWYTILSSKHPTLTAKCLKTMQNYIDWIDISLVTNEKFATLFYQYINIPKLRDLCCECLLMVCSSI
jgi:exportin-T